MVNLVKNACVLIARILIVETCIVQIDFNAARGTPMQLQSVSQNTNKWKKKMHKNFITIL